MLGFSQYRRHWLAAAVGALLVVNLVCVHAPAVAKKTQAADKSKADTSAACRRGNTLFALGRFGAAEAAFEKDLETGATVKCGREGLRKIGRRYPCVAARSLAKNGEKAESNKAYIELLKTKPRKQCARDGADSSSNPDIWEWFKTTSEDAVTTIGFFALLALILFALFLVLVNIQARIRGLRDRWPASCIRRPALSIEALGDSGLATAKVGKATTALLKEKVEPGSSAQAAKIVSGDSSAEGTWIKTVGELGDQAKLGAAIVELFKALLPRRRFKVSGEIHSKAAKSGPGISIELDRKLISKGGNTLWADEFFLSDKEEVEALRRLATPAAAWISHVVVSRSDGEPTLTEDPMSWAKFKAGLEWQLEGDRDRAKELYKAAITADPANYGAIVNLALLTGGDGKYKEAVTMLEDALAIIEGKGK
jgi:tetratricopeptide (TPR) repeat protein